MKKTSTLLSVIGGALIGISGCASQRVIDSPLPISPHANIEIASPKFKESEADKNAEKKWNGELATTFASNYVCYGFVVGNGPVNQTSLTYTKKEFLNENMNVYAKVWSDWDLGRNVKNDEIDFILGFNFPSGMIYSKPEYKDTIDFSFQHWNYPSGLFGNRDNALVASFKHHSRGDVELYAVHIFENSGRTEQGNLYGLKVSKTFNVSESKDIKTSLTAQVFDIGFGENFYGLNNFLYVTPSISFNVEDKKNPLIWRFFINQQIGINEKVKDQLHGGIEFKYRF